MRGGKLMLDRVDVASPCTASWDAMRGDERVRFCGLCSMNVYNLSGMSREEAERLVGTAEGRTCIRFFRRQDGTILTADCPVGLAARVRRRVRVATAALVAFLGLGGVLAAIASRAGSMSPRTARALQKIWPEPERAIAGEMVCPPPNTPAPGGQ